MACMTLFDVRALRSVLLVSVICASWDNLILVSKYRTLVFLLFPRKESYETFAFTLENDTKGEILLKKFFSVVEIILSFLLFWFFLTMMTDFSYFRCSSFVHGSWILVSFSPRFWSDSWNVFLTDFVPLTHFLVSPFLVFVCQGCSSDSKASVWIERQCDVADGTSSLSSSLTSQVM